jgi:hypothetical protein
MASLSFNVKPIDNGTLQIYAVFRNGEQRTAKYLGHDIPDSRLKEEYKCWDKKNKKVRSLPAQVTINEKISDWRSRFDKYKKLCFDNGIKPDIEAFKKSLDSKTEITIEKRDTTMLLDMAIMFVADIQKTHKPGTTKAYDTVIDDIKRFQKETSIKVLLRDVNKEFYKNYGLYLIETENNINNTVNRKIGRIITIMNFAFPKYIQTKEYEDRYKFKGSEAKRFALWPEECEKLWNAKPKTAFGRLVLDAFHFSCETSLRVSDIYELYPHHKTDYPHKGKKIPILDLSQVKTTHLNTLALTDRALEIWNRNATGKAKRVFDFKHSQSANQVLKDICKDLKLTRQCEIITTIGNKVVKETKPLYELISYHMSRNTSVTNQLSKMPPAIVMKNTGIKKVETVMGYFKDDQAARFLTSLDALNINPHHVDK